MGMHDKIIMHLTGHAPVEATTDQVDHAIARYLPASPYMLREKVDRHENNDFPTGHYQNLITVTELLLVLAELDNRQES